MNVTAVRQLSIGLRIFFKVAFGINLSHAEYQVPNGKIEWFMAILVFFTAVNSCNYPYIKAFQPYNHLLFLLGSSIFGWYFGVIRIPGKRDPPVTKLVIRAGTLKIVGFFYLEKSTLVFFIRIHILKKGKTSSRGVFFSLREKKHKKAYSRTKK